MTYLFGDDKMKFKIGIKSIYENLKVKKVHIAYYAMSIFAIAVLSLFLTGNILTVLGDPIPPLPPGDTPLP